MREMVAWWTNLDIEVVCSHNDDTTTFIQNGDIDEDGKIIICPECGQKYIAFLIIKPIEELNETKVRDATST